MSNIKEKINLVFCANDKYSLALSTAVRSIAVNSPNSEFDIYILEDDISGESKSKILTSWKDLNIKVHWISPDKSHLEGVPFIGHAGSSAAYFKLLIGDVLPKHVTKVIYLDCDLVVVGDIRKLYEIAFEESTILAVSEPFVFSGQDVFKRFPKEVVENRDSGYLFNSGVMVIDLEKWRKGNIGSKALDIAKKYKDCMVHNDQDPLNLVLKNKWKQISPIWNKLFDSYLLDNNSQTTYSLVDIKDLKENPQIIHFNSSLKPWDLGCIHPDANQFFKFADGLTWVIPSQPTKLQAFYHQIISKTYLARKYIRIMKYSTVASSDYKANWSKLIKLLSSFPLLLVTVPVRVLFLNVLRISRRFS